MFRYLFFICIVAYSIICQPCTYIQKRIFNGPVFRVKGTLYCTFYRYRGIFMMTQLPACEICACCTFTKEKQALINIKYVRSFAERLESKTRAIRDTEMRCFPWIFSVSPQFFHMMLHLEREAPLLRASRIYFHFYTAVEIVILMPFKI